MHGKRTISAKVKYSPSAKACSRGGSSEVFIFLIWEGSLLVETGFFCTVNLERDSSKSAGDDSWFSLDFFSSEELFLPSLTSEFFCWTFCLRILSSLCTLTGSPNFFSNCRTATGILWCWSGDSLRKSSTARGMLISQSLVHSLTYNRQWISGGIIFIGHPLWRTGREFHRYPNQKLYCNPFGCQTLYCTKQKEP